jgi:hypothetical protein
MTFPYRRLRPSELRPLPYTMAYSKIFRGLLEVVSSLATLNSPATGGLKIR